MKIRTNQGRVGSPKQPPKSRPRIAPVGDLDEPTENFVALTRCQVLRIDSQSFKLLCSSCVVSVSLSPHLGHRSACPIAGVLGRRGFPLENVAARICQEAGDDCFRSRSRFAWINNLDDRRLEVVVDGLPLFRGAQLAIDTTLVCPLTREGVAKPRCATENGASLERARTPKFGFSESPGHVRTA